MPESDSPLCPLPARLDPASLGRVQVFAPHPDDESIGCGGLLALLARQHCEVQVVLVSDGSGAGGLPPGAATIRAREFVAALQELGIDNCRQLGFPDGELRQDSTLASALFDTMAVFAPQSIIMPAILDLHRDHRVVAATLYTQAKLVPSVRQLIQYEVWSPLPATHLVDISQVAETKWRAIKQHKTALACGDYLTASQGLALYRGLLLGQPGTHALAEAFVIDSLHANGNAASHWLSDTARSMLQRLPSR